MKKALVMCLLLLTIVSMSAIISKQQAIQKVKTLVGSDSIYVKIHVKNNTMSQPTKLNLFSGEALTLPYAQNWVLLVDNLPMAKWDHPCRYFFIDAGNVNNYQIMAKTIFPSPEYSDFANINGNPTPPTPPTPLVPTVGLRYPVNPHLYGVIICPDLLNAGSWFDDQSFYNDMC